MFVPFVRYSDGYCIVFFCNFQEEMVQWLDSLTDKSQYVLDYELKSAYPEIDDICTNRLVGAPLGKFIKKLLTKHELDPKLASKNLRAKTTGAFKYLVREKSSPSMSKFTIRHLLRGHSFMTSRKFDTKLTPPLSQSNGYFTCTFITSVTKVSIPSLLA